MRGKVVEERFGDVLHEKRTEKSEEDDPGEDEGPVGASFIEEVCFRVEMREIEEFGSVRLWDEKMSYC